MQIRLATICTILVIAFAPAPVDGAPTADQAETEAGIRDELASVWKDYAAWKYFWEWNDNPEKPQQFRKFQKSHEGSIAQTWLPFVRERDKLGSRLNRQFGVSVEIAEEFTELLKRYPNIEEDPSQAFTAFEQVLWERTELQFRVFLSKHPQSVFSPEVNWHLAELAQNDPVLRDNPNPDPQSRRTTVYLKRAVEGYGRQFSTAAYHARATLANGAGSVDALLDHYKWEMNLIDKGTEQDIHPIERVGNFLEGYPIQVPKGRLSRMLESAKRNMRGAVTRLTIPTIVRRASPLELERIVMDYPGTELAEKASDPEYAVSNRTPRQLQDLIRDYPDTELAELARKRLAERKRLANHSSGR
jgi:hypothetical protein